MGPTDFLEPERCEFKSQLCHLLTLWPHFLTCKVGVLNSIHPRELTWGEFWCLTHKGGQWGWCFSVSSWDRGLSQAGLLQSQGDYLWGGLGKHQCESGEVNQKRECLMCGLPLWAIRVQPLWDLWKQVEHTLARWSSHLPRWPSTHSKWGAGLNFQHYLLLVSSRFKQSEKAS